jgi:predicted TIM-barrel fold metal-dependent hydrolase
MLDLSAIPILDHHAHPLLRPEATSDVARFRRWFSETSSDLVREQHIDHALVYTTAIKWLAQVLDCEPTPEAYLAARARYGYPALCQLLLRDANIPHLIFDYGYTSPEVYTHEEHLALLPAQIDRMLRLEVLAQDLIVRNDTFDQMIDAYLATVGRARADGYVALKSIIAYRTGLKIEPVTRSEAAAAFAPLKEEARRNGRVRLASKALCDYLIDLALVEARKQALPFQFHTGFGDSDADLRVANPLQLRTVIEGYTDVQLVLLHAGWPFYRELAHFAAIYPNVWMDLSLAVPFATAGIPAMLRDVLGMAPLSKVMFATDAFTMPEIFWIAARWGRWALGKVLEEFISEGFLSQAEALTAAQQILHGNAMRVYGVESL